MNRVVIAIIAVAVVIAGIVAYILLGKPQSSQTAKSSPTPSLLPTADIKACDVLTRDIATSIMGNNIQKKDGSDNTSTDDMSTTTCTYVPNIDPSKGISKLSGLQLLARIAKTEAAAKSNIEAFNGKPSGSQDVPNLGDKAFYTPDFKQLNILKGGNWYLVTNYEDFLAQKASLDSDLLLAQKLQFK